MSSDTKERHDTEEKEGIVHDDDDDDDDCSSSPVTLATVVLHRHGQGQHNVKGLHLPDPPLTAQGLQEARDIGVQYRTGALATPQLVIVSPLQRTLMTAVTAMETMIDCGNDSQADDAQSVPKVPNMIATDLCREINNLNACNYRALIRRQQFPTVDFSRVLTDTGDDGPNGHEYRPKLKDQVQVLQRRCRKFLNFLQQQVTERQVRHVSVFTHASFLRSLSCVVMGLNAHHGVPPLPTGGTMCIDLRREAGVVATPPYWVLADGCSVVVSQLPHIVVVRPDKASNHSPGEDSSKGEEVG